MNKKNVKQDKHDLFSFNSCLSTNCTYSYKGETGRCLSESVLDYTGRGTKSHIVSHCSNSDHETVNFKNFKILSMGYKNNTYRWRISEALLEKQHRQSLSVQNNSVLLELLIDFNCASLATL